jgi:hypothetical protein
MKQNILIAAMAMLCTPALAQNAPKYCDLDVYRPAFKNYVATVNYGTEHKKVTVKNNAIKDASGSTVKFLSELEAVNYMAQQGWELVSSYKVHGGDTHFYMKKVG